MKKWNNPEFKNLIVGDTKEEEPLYWNPFYPECDDIANTGPGYQLCNYHDRPCKYFGLLAGCNAPSSDKDPNKPNQPQS